MTSVPSRFIGATLCFAIACGSVLADSSAAGSDFDAGIDIQLEHEHQEFSQDSANANIVDLAPHLQYGSWDFSLDAPWISADANYVNNQFPSRAVTRCDKASQHTRFAQNHPHSVIAKILAACDAAGVVPSGDTISGISDITVFAHYGASLDDNGIWLLSLGAGYKIR